MYKEIVLKYNYKDLEPYYNKDIFISKYNNYVINTKILNNILNEFKIMRKTSNYQKLTNLNKELSIYSNMYILYTLFFENLIPMPNKTLLSDELINQIKIDFESYDNFINQLNNTLFNIKSGFVIFGYNLKLKRLLIINDENIQISFIPLLVIDMNYYGDKNEYIRNLFYILDFNVVSNRYKKIYNFV